MYSIIGVPVFIFIMLLYSSDISGKVKVFPCKVCGRKFVPESLVRKLMPFQINA